MKSMKLLELNVDGVVCGWMSCHLLCALMLIAWLALTLYRPFGPMLIVAFGSTVGIVLIKLHQMSAVDTMIVN